MADIAFLLLIFFLVSTTMNTDTGIMRKLPAKVDGPIVQTPQRNIFQIYLNSSDQIMADGKVMTIEELSPAVYHFLTPRPDQKDNNDFAKTKEIELDFVGKIHKSKGIISLTNDRGTSYQQYIAVQNAVAQAIKKHRNEFSKKHFGVSFVELLSIDKDKAKVVQKAVPISLSEAEPVEF
jgi:biopolymer transport protein ExbD